MPPILDGTADLGRWQQSPGLLALCLSIPREIRICILSAILLAEVIVLGVL